ncbi:MAG: peptide MFS transporter, partial [Rhodothermales bacterium]
MNSESSLAQKQWFGHPRALSTLFFTEMWERFSYYGMRGILILFMAAPLVEGGLAFNDAKAAAIYGLYTSMVYLLALPGGWVADKLWGQQRAVFVGGCIIASGHFSMALPAFGAPDQIFFFLGLILIVIGTGLLKPNVSTIVGELYPEGGARRDAGFSVFYMGINVGAFIGPLACGFLGENISWHLGFSAAGFGMVLGLIQYKLGAKYLGNAGLLSTGEEPTVVTQRSRKFYLTFAGVVAVVALFILLAVLGVFSVTLTEVATAFGYGILIMTGLFFAYLTLDKYWAGGFLLLTLASLIVLSLFIDWETAAKIAVGVAVGGFLIVNLIRLILPRVQVTVDKKRFLVIFWLFILAAVFWSGFEQAGSSMNLFADRFSDRVFGPYTWMGMISTTFLTFLVAAILGYFWYKLYKRNDLFLIEKLIAGLFCIGLVIFAYWLLGELTLGWEMPTSWLQAINPIFIIIGAPIFGWLWTWLASRNANPSIPVKFALGLFGLAAGFFVIAWGSANASAENQVT